MSDNADVFVKIDRVHLRELTGSGNCFQDAHGHSYFHISFYGTGGTLFYPPTGDVTYLGITQDKDGHFKFVVAEGVNEDGPIFTFGDTNMRTRFSIGAREFCNRWSEAGPTHHMAAAVGRHIDTILKVAKILNVPVDIICR